MSDSSMCIQSPTTAYSTAAQETNHGLGSSFAFSCRLVLALGDKSRFLFSCVTRITIDGLTYTDPEGVSDGMAALFGEDNASEIDLDVTFSNTDEQSIGPRGSDARWRYEYDGGAYDGKCGSYNVQGWVGRRLRGSATGTSIRPIVID